MREPAIPLEAFLPRIENPTLEDMLDPVRFARLCEQTRRDARERDLVQVRVLLAAGWKYEIPDGYDDAEPMSWYWRAPPKRANSRGRKYLSTNQAFNAMRRLAQASGSS